MAHRLTPTSSARTEDVDGTPIVRPTANSYPAAVASTSAPDTTLVADGRNRRRERNRDAVVEALLAIYREGDLAPNADKIAARAGISARSLFRYFEDIDALVRTAIAHQQRHLAPLYALDAPADLPLDERLDRFVAARTRLLAGMGEVGRVARSLAATQPRILAELRRVRAALRDQLAAAFAPELDRLGTEARQAAIAALDVAASWEAHDLLLHDAGLTPAAAAEVMRSMLAALLAGPGDR
jgi:AcrR family transcriptional regulator